MDIDIAPKKIKINLKEYGEFEVIPLGAGAEATLRVANRKMLELAEEAQKFEDAVNSDDEKKKEEALAAFKAANKALDDYRDLFVEKMHKVFKGKRVDDLFEDFTEQQIEDIYHKALSYGRTA